MKFHGKIGFEGTVDNGHGVYTPVSEELPYYGDVLMNNRRWESSNASTNDNIQLDNRISIVANSHIRKNMGMIRYVIWNDVKWKVSSIEIAWPRLILHLGEVYNG